MKVRAFIIFLFISFIFQRNIIQAQNSPERIQALITQITEQLEKNTDSFPELIQEVETYTQTCSDSVEIAILHSMIAEMYHNYLDRHRFQISRRTELTDYQPTDLREWSLNLFNEKIKKELTLSLQPAPLLQQTPISKYNLILEKGKDTPTLRPTVYDFLVYRAIEIQPAIEWYNDLLSFRQTQPQKQALLFDELAYWQYKYEKQLINATYYNHLLDSLYTQYKNKDYAAEIFISKLHLLESQRYQGDSTQQDSTQAAIYSLCQECIAKYSQYSRVNIFKNQLNEMETPSLDIQTNNNVYPGKDLCFNINYKNTPQLTICIYRSQQSPEQTWQKEKTNLNKRGELIEKHTVFLSLPTPYTKMDTLLTFPMKQLGFYEYEITAPGKELTISNYFSVSRLATVSRSQKEATEVFVTDLESGKPIEGATVISYQTNKNDSLEIQSQIKTNRFGLASFPIGKKVMLIRPIFQEDTASVITNIYPYRRNNSTSQERVELSIFTDRGIYRPGQTIYFKGIAYVQSCNTPHVVSGKDYTITLLDTNNKIVTQKTFQTDSFGSFNGEFMIPKQTLSGTFTLDCGTNRINIRVEEYKRPTFQVELLPLKEEVYFGHPLQIQGKAELFSGITLQGGKINWTITPSYFWGDNYLPIIPRYYNNQSASGTTEIDNQGNFFISFTPEVPKADLSYPIFLSYRVRATVTDSKGETQEASYTFTVGNQGLLFKIQLPNDIMDRDSAYARVTAYTANEEEVTIQGKYTLYSLLEEKVTTDLLNKETYKINKAVTSGTFMSGDELSSILFHSFPARRYRLEVQATDSKGQVVSNYKDFILYNRQDKQPPVFMHTWLIKTRTTCLPGEEALFTFGTSDKETYILYEIFSIDQRCTERKLLRLNNENKNFRIPFKETDGNGFSVSFTFVKEGKLYTERVPIYRRQPDQKLNIYAETFRNHLLPGSQEYWKFRITNADSIPVTSEVLVSMYDASLDKLEPFKWYFSPQKPILLSSPIFYRGNSFGKKYQSDRNIPKHLPVSAYQYDKLNWQNFFEPISERPIYSISEDRQVFAMKNTILKEARVASTAYDAQNVQEEAIENKPISTPIQFRENFAETAFFYPALKTDNQGEVSFSFTAPESNTTWKLQLLAQTKDLKYGYLSKEVITSKPLMITPNLPRFLREGDEVTITAQISNQSQEPIEGKAILELFDPNTDQPIICLSKSQKPFTLMTGNTTSVSWSFQVPTTPYGIIGCRILAQGDKGSDGEQHLIPVLSNQILITASTPFYLFDTDKQVIPLKNKNGIQPFRTTLELTANPIWYAVQALPTLTQPENENIISWFASYYSNTLAYHIATINPRIQQIIKQWETQGKNTSTLYSNLEKNTELKTILLQESPWVLEAENETEQKQRLALLFDLNRAANQRAIALQQLLEQQTKDGGWGWFKGMYTNHAITLYILKGMSRLTQMQAIEYNQQEKEMQIKALYFLDKEIQKTYTSLQKSKNWEKSPIPAWIVDYLFVRSYYRDIPVLGEAQEAILFYTNLAEKQWGKLSLYEKGEIAWLMYRNGDQKTANQILTWLRKTATITPKEGMFWANNRRENSFLISPIDTHSLLMALFQELSPNKEECDRMKQWLLNQKRTQSWESVPATCNAIYALLTTGSDWLSSNNTCTVQWGDQTYSTNQVELGTGYLKISHNTEKEKDSSDNILSITKVGTSPAWGAVYEQYFQSINEVDEKKGLLNVEKKLFVETNTGTDIQLRPISSEQPLQIGDKVIIRLVIRTDQEMNYVVLKYLRAGCFDPVNQQSGLGYREGVWYYQSPTDISENFYFDRLPQGTYVLEYAVYVSRPGTYTEGISTIQCLYAPEFVSHTKGGELRIN
ncbi:MAG: alpha-2-macroglobulin [Parabacteroides sp.]|nr:alpha-2-macroglobulin [Parabacteroides sp.]